jgi:integrase
MRAKLTKRYLDSVAIPIAKDDFHWDTDLTGFGARVKPSGVKSFLIQYRNRLLQSQRYTFGRYGVLTVDQARATARQLLAGIGRGEDPAERRAADRSSITMSQLCDEYLKAAEEGTLITRRRQAKKASTVYTDRGRIERHIKPLLGRRAVSEIDSSDIEAFQRSVIAGKTAKDEKTKFRGRAIVRGGRGAATRTVGLLGGIFSYAIKHKIRMDNPVRGVVRTKDRKRSVRLDHEQYRTLGDALSKAEQAGEPWQAIAAIRLLALTGCRKAEIEQLRWTEVDFGGHCLRLVDTKTDASIRPIGSPALDLLRELKRSAKGEHVLHKRQGQPFKGHSKAWRRIVPREGLADLSPHGLRHAFSSTCEAEGLTVPTIAALLGHAGHGVTQGYIHKADSALIAAADRVARVIWRAMTGETAEVVTLPTARAAS